MRIIAAYLLAVLGGNEHPKSEDINRILASVGIEADPERLNDLVKKLEGQNVYTLINQGLAKLSSLPVGGGGGGGGGVVASATAKAGAPAGEGQKADVKPADEKDKGKTDKDGGGAVFGEDDDDDAGGALDLFGGGGDDDDEDY